MIAAGVVLMVIGLLIRSKAMLDMKNFSLAIKYTDKMVNSGIYKYVKHPAYVGSILFIAGVSFISLQAAFIFMVFVFFLARAIQEEIILSKNDNYVEYSKKTGMFLPKFNKAKKI